VPGIHKLWHAVGPFAAQTGIYKNSHLRDGSQLLQPAHLHQHTPLDEAILAENVSQPSHLAAISPATWPRMPFACRRVTLWVWRSGLGHVLTFLFMRQCKEDLQAVTSILTHLVAPQQSALKAPGRAWLRCWIPVPAETSSSQHIADTIYSS
jgi:hypothetical protein